MKERQRGRLRQTVHDLEVPGSIPARVGYFSVCLINAAMTCLTLNRPQKYNVSDRSFTTFDLK